MGGGHGLGQREPGRHVPREGDGLAAEGDQVAGHAVLGVFHGDMDGPRCHVIAAQPDHHLRNAAAHVQLDHGGGGPDPLGLPIGGRVTVDDIADDMGAVAAVGRGGGAVRSDIDGLLRRPRRQAGTEQAHDGTQHQYGGEHALGQFLHT